MRKSKRAQRSTKSLSWEKATDVEKRVFHLIYSLKLNWIKGNIHCFRSQNSQAKALARIWGLPRIWQIALRSEAAYVLEVISERFDKLSPKEKDKVLLHELAHIPKTFSGALLPHTHKRKGSFKEKLQNIITAYNQAYKK